MKNKAKKIIIGVAVSLLVAIIAVTTIGMRNSQLNSADTFTKGEWIKLLLEKTETDLLQIELPFFSDTATSEYGQAVETAYAMGILPNEDYGEENTFGMNETANREFVAFTVYNILGFCSVELLECEDFKIVKYQDEAALMIKHGFLTLLDGKFMPKQELSAADKDMIFEKIDYFNAYKQISEEDEVCEIEFLEDVVELEIPEGYDYSQTDDLYRLKIKKEIDISKVKEGELLLITQGVGYEKNDLYRVNTVTEEADKNIIECVRPNLDDVIGEYEIVEKARILPVRIYVAEGVECEFESSKEQRGGKNSNYEIEKHFENIVSINYTFANQKIGGEDTGITLNGEISVDLPEIVLLLKGKGSNIKELSVSLSHKESFKGDLKWNIEEVKNRKVDKVEIATIWTPINPALWAKLTLYVEFDMSAEVSLSWEIDSVTDIQYKDGTFRMTSEATEEMDAREIKAKLKLGAVPNLALNLLGCEDLIGLDMPIGVTGTASRTMYKDMEPELVCDDLAAYLYFSIKLDKESMIGKILDEVHLGLEKSIWKQSNSPCKVETHTENGEWVEKCTYAGKSTTVYGLSKQAYDEAAQVSEKYYVVKENGFYGMVDFKGNQIVPLQYSAYEIVAEDEIEFSGNDEAYVYDINTGKRILKYVQKEEIAFNKVFESFQRDYDENFDLNDSLWDVINIEVIAINESDEEKCYLYRDYQNGMYLEKIRTTWIYNYKEDFYEHWLVTYKNVDTDETIYSGYSSYIYTRDEAEQFWFGGFSTDKTEDRAIMLEEAKDGTDSLVIVSSSGYERKAFSYDFESKCIYDNGWIKDYLHGRLINIDTQEQILMPMQEGEVVCANGKFYVSALNGNYMICNADTIMKRACEFVDFVNDEYIVLKHAIGEYVYIDYEGNDLLSVVDYGRFIDGRALVYDGNGVYYMDESLEKIGDYIYKGNVDGCDTGVVEIEGRYYLVGRD